MIMGNFFDDLVQDAHKNAEVSQWFEIVKSALSGAAIPNGEIISYTILVERAMRIADAFIMQKRKRIEEEGEE